MTMFKISRRCPWIISSRSYKNQNPTTVRHINQKICTEKQKKLGFLKNRPQKSGLKFLEKTRFWMCFCFSDHSKKFSTHPMTTFKVSRRCPWIIPLRSNKHRNRVTHQSKDMYRKAKKNSFFWKIDLKKGGEISPKNTVFQGVFAFQITLKNFLRIQWPCSRYLEGAPGSYLYTHTKIRTVRHTNQKIFQKNRSRKGKKRIFPTSLE